MTDANDIAALRQGIAEARAALSARRPLVQCLTNTVSSNFVANVLLAAGASPAMVDNPEEAAGFAAIADAVLVNLGTPTASQVAAMEAAAEAARHHGRPWVLDPVGAASLPWRGRVAAGLLRFGPHAIRGNASEIAGLARLACAHDPDEAEAGGRGVDSASTPDKAIGAAHALLAQQQARAVSASGPVDHVLGRRGDAIVLVRVAGGSALLPRVTATGCALGALAAAYCAVAADPLTGLVAAHAHMAVAAERADDVASGPGSFAASLLDAIDASGPDEIRRGARISLGVPAQPGHPDPDAHRQFG